MQKKEREPYKRQVIESVLILKELFDTLGSKMGRFSVNNDPEYPDFQKQFNEIAQHFEKFDYNIEAIFADRRKQVEKNYRKLKSKNKAALQRKANEWMDGFFEEIDKIRNSSEPS